MLLTFYMFINNSGVDFTMIVDIEKLSVDYSGIKAIDNLSFGIDEGDFLGIIGPNGAGKSTLFNVCLDCIRSMTEQSRSLVMTYATRENICRR